MKEDTKISKIWITGKSSYTIVIPKRFAQELGFTQTDHVIMKKIPEGILIRKLEIIK